MGSRLLTTATRAARLAGQYLRAAPPADRRQSVKESRHSVVTPGDLEAQRIIIDAIRKEEPNARILSEESQESIPDTSGPLWIVDPIDGTSCFARGLPEYSVAIARLDDSGVEVGVVFCPALDELFWAERGSGAWLNGSRIRVSDVADPSSATLALGHRFLRERWTRPSGGALLEGARSIRTGGSIAQEIALVACGRADGALALSQSLWDYVAARLILEEAGGRITDLDGRPAGLRPGTRRQDILATNGPLHQWCLDQMRQG